MNTQILAAKINQYFPGNVGIVLTGSQANNIVFNNISDIDAVVLCRASSDVHSYGINFNGFRVDCTILPLWDIENVLENENEHERGILLTMLATGKMISGNNAIVAFVQASANGLVGKQSKTVKGSHNELVAELNRLDKYFKRETTEVEKIVLLSELVHLTTNLEVIKHTSRHANYLKKTAAILQANLSFFEELKTVFYKVLNNNDTEIVTSFIAHCLQAEKKENTNGATSFIAVDIYLNISNTDFASVFLPKLLQDEYVQKHYCYFYRSLNKYHRIYKYTFTIVFTRINYEDELNILSALKKVVSLQTNTGTFNFHLSVPPSEMLVELNKTLCLTYHMAIVEDKLKQVVAFLLQWLCKKLGVDITEFVNLNKILIQKWVLTRVEQKDLKQHTDIFKIQKYKLNALDKLFKKHTENIGVLLNSNAINEIITNQELLKKLELLQEQIIDVLPLVNQVDKYSYWGDCILELMQIQNLHEAKAYLILVQEIFTLFNLSDAEKLECIYFSSLMAIEMP